MELTQAKRILAASLPAATCRTQLAGDWRGPIALPDALLGFYSEVGPVDLEIWGIGNPWFVPSLAQLWDLQAGYRFNSITGEPIPDWNDDWIVVAYEGGDPFILDTRNGTILHAHHGQGAWAPQEIFTNLAEMIAVFATLGGIVLRAGDSLMGEDGYVRARYLTEARSALEEILANHEAVVAKLESLGWE